MTGQPNLMEQPPEMSDEDIFAEELARRQGVDVKDLQTFSDEPEPIAAVETPEAGTPPLETAPPDTPPVAAAPPDTPPVATEAEPVQQVVEEGKPAWYAEASDEVKASFDALNQDLGEVQTQYTALHGRLAPMQQQNERLRQQVEHVDQRPPPSQPNSSATSGQQPGQAQPGTTPTPPLDLETVPEFAEFKEAFPEEAKAMQALFGRQAEHVNDLQQQLGSVSQGLEKIQQASFGQERKQGLDKLAAAHPDWMQVNPSEDFGNWLQTQPPSIARLSNSNDADECIWILDRYKQDVWAQRQIAEPAAPQPPAAPSAVQTVRTRRQQIRSVPGVDPQGGNVGVPAGTPEEFMTGEDIWDEEVKRRLKLQRDQRL
jgi:hypothetical protein